MDDTTFYFSASCVEGYTPHKTYEVETISTQPFTSPIGRDELPDSKQIVITILTTIFNWE